VPESKGTAVIARPRSRYEGEVFTYVIRIVHAVDGREYHSGCGKHGTWWFTLCVVCHESEVGSNYRQRKKARVATAQNEI